MKQKTRSAGSAFLFVEMAGIEPASEKFGR